MQRVAAAKLDLVRLARPGDQGETLRVVEAGRSGAIE